MTAGESLLGFQMRLKPDLTPAWTAERRGSFLLRDDVARPLSVDAAVWPSFEDTAVLGGIFEDYLPVPNGLKVQGAPADSQRVAPGDGTVVAITAMPEAARKLRDFHKIEGGVAPLAELPKIGFRLIGYDVADEWLLSGLMNCGLDAATKRLMEARFAKALNDKGLFESVDQADEFRVECDRCVPEHAPFFVYGLWARL